MSSQLWNKPAHLCSRATSKFKLFLRKQSIVYCLLFICPTVLAFTFISWASPTSWLPTITAISCHTLGQIGTVRGVDSLVSVGSTRLSWVTNDPKSQQLTTTKVSSVLYVHRGIGFHLHHVLFTLGPKWTEQSLWGILSLWQGKWSRQSLSSPLKLLFPLHQQSNHVATSDTNRACVAC